MKNLLLAVSYALVLLPCVSYGQTDRYQLQSCLNLEYANVLANAPPGLTEQDAYKLGYSQGFDFVLTYEQQLRSLPNPEVEVPEILRIASDAGYRMAKNLTRKQITQALERCRNS